MEVIKATYKLLASTRTPRLLTRWIQLSTVSPRRTTDWNGAPLVTRLLAVVLGPLLDDLFQSLLSGLPLSDMFRLKTNTI